MTDGDPKMRFDPAEWSPIVSTSDRVWQKKDDVVSAIVIARLISALEFYRPVRVAHGVGSKEEAAAYEEVKRAMNEVEAWLNG